MEGHLISAALGLVTGIVGSLAAPWAQWGIERRRRQLDRRSELITHWRTVLSKNDFERIQILNDPTYGILAELLPKDVSDQLERGNSHLVIVLDSPRDADRTALQRGIAHIEKRWRLI